MGSRAGWRRGWRRTRPGVRGRPRRLLGLWARRARLLHSTPVEALEVAITAGAVTDAVTRWGNAAERLSNLDALRGLARSYDDDCRAHHPAATATPSR